MNVVFYNTNTNYFDPDSFLIKTYPKINKGLSSFVQNNPSIKVSIVCQMPGMFLINYDGNKITDKIQNVEYHLIDETQSNAESITDLIKKLEPDLVIAASYFLAPYDWLNIKDSIIAQNLKKSGINVLCHSIKTNMSCFDKWETNSRLKKLGCNTPDAVYVNHELFFKTSTSIKENIYKQAVLEQIKQMNFPVVIKETTGLSSYNMDVVKTFGQAKDLLCNGKNKSDRIVEEYIPGIQAGTEVYGKDGNYTVMPPFIFSVNQFGITSPKQSIKYGPVTENKYHLKELYTLIESVAKDFNFKGIAQFDLVLNNDKWFIIEINSRLSGMTGTYCSALNTNIFQLLFDIAQNKKIQLKSNDNLFVNFKLPLLDKNQEDYLKNIKDIIYINQIQNKKAKQEREKGYTEIIIKKQSITSFIELLDKIKEEQPSLIEEIFYQRAVELLKKADNI